MRQLILTSRTTCGCSTACPGFINWASGVQCSATKLSHHPHQLEFQGFGSTWIYCAACHQLGFCGFSKHNQASDTYQTRLQSAGWSQQTAKSWDQGILGCLVCLGPRSNSLEGMTGPSWHPPPVQNHGVNPPTHRFGVPPKRGRSVGPSDRVTNDRSQWTRDAVATRDS